MSPKHPDLYIMLKKLYLNKKLMEVQNTNKFNVIELMIFVKKMEQYHLQN